ncbi:hypothetical protein [Streptomyces sp. x-80]|jgi:hypothetical protein|uniref:hypothetical protein n=1 Tax=Streptomyces sp. x-80 TaxID=2789282 RepID=UPI003981031F
MPAQKDDDDSDLSLIAGLGAATNASNDPSLSDSEREVARDLAEGFADRLKNQ